MRVLTAAQMKKAEEDAVLAGTSYEQLMENAGATAARVVMDIAEKEALPKTVLLLCGRGNNAGDAFVAARHLAEAGWTGQTLPLCGDEYSNLARYNLLKVPAQMAAVSLEEADFSAAFIVDGVFGTGFHGPLPPAVKEAFHRANTSGAVRVALDLPSGLASDTGNVADGTFQANCTVTFGAYKPGLMVLGNKGYTGEVLVVDIGL